MTEERAAIRERISEANDIVDVVGGYIALHPTARIQRPLSLPRRSQSLLNVDPRRQRYRCWSCGEQGDVFAFVQKFEKITFPEALELLARRAGISLEKIQKFPQVPAAPVCLT